MNIDLTNYAPEGVESSFTPATFSYKNTPVNVLIPDKIYVDEIKTSATDLVNKMNKIFNTKIYRTAIGSDPEPGYVYLKNQWKEEIIKTDVFKKAFEEENKRIEDESKRLKEETEEKVKSARLEGAKAAISENVEKYPITDLFDEGQKLYDDLYDDKKTTKTTMTTSSTRSILQELPSYTDRVAFLRSIKSLSKASATKLMDDYRKAILADPNIDKGEMLSQLFDLAKLEREDIELEQRNIPYVLKEKSVVYNPIELRKRGPSNKY